MTATAPVFSDEQAEAHDRIADSLRGLGVDIDRGTLTPMTEGKSDVLAVIGKAGSGKTLLLAALTRALEGAGVEIVSGDWEGRRRKDRRTLAILAPTNKAASVCCATAACPRPRSTASSTPVYDPEYEKPSPNGWPGRASAGDRRPDRRRARPGLCLLPDKKSIPGALAAAGLRGSDFITGWKRRDDPLDIGWSTKARCSTKSSSRTSRRSSRPWCCSAIRRSSPRWASRARWCSTGSARDQMRAAPHPPAGGRQPDPRPRPCAGRRPGFERFERMVEEAAARDDRVVHRAPGRQPT
jgi:hypothetical protein